MSVEFCVRVGGGINIGIPNEPKFAVIEISRPGNRRHSVEQSLRHRRIELFLRLSLDVKLDANRDFFWINEQKRIFFTAYSAASCLSQPWIRNSGASLIRKEKDFNLWKMIWTPPPRSCIRPLSSLESSLCIEVEVKELRLMPVLPKERQARFPCHSFDTAILNLSRDV